MLVWLVFAFLAGVALGMFVMRYFWAYFMDI